MNIECKNCGKSPSDGAYLVRTNPKGQPGEWRCEPVCGVPWISDEAKILHAIAPPEPE